MKFLEANIKPSTLIPLSNFKIPAGFPSPALDYIEDRIDLAQQLAPHPLSTYYSYCEGDSMLVLRGVHDLLRCLALVVDRHDVE